MKKHHENRHKWAVRMLRVYMALGAVLLLSGCAHTYVPKESTYSTDKIPTYKVGSQVRFENGQPSTLEVLYAENMGHDFFANLNTWTDKAIGIADRELTARGSKTAINSGHTLTLKVSSVKVTTGGWGFRGKVTLGVVTGEGIARSFSGEAPSSNLYNASSGALAASVTAMLSDPTIISYLTR